MKKHRLRKVDIVGLTFGLVIGSGLTYVFAVSGNEVDYDNTSSKLSATTVQAAIDELYDNYQNCDKCDIEEGKVYNFSYTGSEQTFTVPCDGNYKVELWGAQGGNSGLTTDTPNVNYGKGAYTQGTINLKSQEKLYVYVGQMGKDDRKDTYNGGGHGGYACGSGDGTGNCFNTPESNINYSQYFGNSGGGATDIRLVSGTWNNTTSLGSRIMVAGGGGARQPYESAGEGNYAGGLIGYKGTYYAGHGDKGFYGYGGTQVSGGSGGGNFDNTSINTNVHGVFGIGGSSDSVSTRTGAGGGGGGWYGGGAGGRTNYGGNGHPGGGGSSYISGHTGCVAITSKTDNSPKSGCTTGTTSNECSISPYEYKFTSTKMIDGSGYSWTNTKGSLETMPNPSGGNYSSGVGHAGNGFAKITYLG